MRLVKMKLIMLAALVPLVACGKKDKDDDGETASEESADDAATDGVSGGGGSTGGGSTGGDAGESSFYSFTCSPDREHTNAAPLFQPPFDLAGLHHKPSSPDFPFDATCAYDTDASCNPGEAIEPVGGLYMPATGVGHFKPTPHMYVSMSRTATVDLKNMARGNVLRVVRSDNNEYGVQILHSCSLYSNYGHVSYLTSPTLRAALDAVIPDWEKAGSSWTIEFGRANEGVHGETRHSALAPVIEDGAVWGQKTTSFGSGNIDFRVVDKRYPRGTIVGADDRTWSIDQFFGDVYELQHALPFMSYFADAERTKWLRFLRVAAAKKPPLTAMADVDAGTATKDLTGKLQGVWFNPKVYGYQVGANRFANYDYTEAAAFTIFERVGDVTKAHLAYGLAGSFGQADGFVETLPQLDPAGWPACTCDESQQACVDSCMGEQKRLSSYVSHFRGFYPRLDLSSPGASVNVSPKSVTVATGLVCYDIDADGATKWDRLYVKMVGDDRLAVKYYPTRTATPSCAANPSVAMDAHTHAFVRGAGK